MPYDSPDTTRPASELTTEVKLHPDLQRKVDDGEQVWIHGTLAFKLEVPVRRDLNAGDELLVTVADADGEVLARCIVEVKPVTFKPIEEKDIGVIGTERAHTALQSDKHWQALRLDV